jgi:hypothetical protein
MRHARLRDTADVPRSNRPRRSGRPARRLTDQDGAAGDPMSGVQRSEQHPDGEWIVRSVSGAASGRVYRCPGCRQELAAGVPHLVTWPADLLAGSGGVGERRHWHAGCWTARHRRH